MKAAIYLRVSTEEQRERQSIATQRDFAERYCALHEIPVAGWYADDGVTGTLPLEQRPEGTRLLEDAKAKKFDTVLIYKLDRLGREPRLILNAVKELEDLGAEAKSMTEPFDTSSPSGRFMLTILSGVAGLERENIIQRSVEGTNRLAREGAWLGGLVPFGYRVEGERRARRLVISEQPLPGTSLSEAHVIRLIYGLAGDEGAIVGLDRFGASAPGELVMSRFGFTVERVADIGRRVVRDGLHDRVPLPDNGMEAH